MSHSYTRRKRNFFIKKDLQGRLSWQFFLLTLLSLTIFSTIFALVSADQLAISYDGQRYQVGSAPLMLAQTFLKSNWIFLLSTSLVIVTISIVLTHKIAGPLYRFEMVIRNMSRRNLDQQIRLRKRDEAKELGDALNRLNQTLSADLRALRIKSEKIGLALQHNRLHEIEEANQQITEILTSYRLMKEQENP